MWKVLNDIPDDQKTLTLRKLKDRYEKDKKRKISGNKLKTRLPGREPLPYLNKATLWLIEHREIGEGDSKVIKRAYEKYKDQAASLKSFTNSVKKRLRETREKWKEWQQENVEKNTVPLKDFAKKHLKAPLKLNKQGRKKITTGNKIF